MTICVLRINRWLPRCCKLSNLQLLGGRPVQTLHINSFVKTIEWLRMSWRRVGKSPNQVFIHRANVPSFSCDNKNTSSIMSFHLKSLLKINLQFLVANQSFRYFFTSLFLSFTYPLFNTSSLGSSIFRRDLYERNVISIQLHFVEDELQDKRTISWTFGVIEGTHAIYNFAPME